MINALGHPQHVLLLGGTSDIALAAAEQWARQGEITVSLAARPGERRDQAVRRLAALGVRVHPFDFDALDVEGHAALIEAATGVKDIDVALVAFGVLDDEEQAWQDHSVAMHTARVNYLGAVSVGVLLGQVLRRQGHGSIVALSSVAGEKVRRSNFVYGSAKAGMDGFYLGLGEALEPLGGHVLVVRPGFVRSKMTEGRQEAPMATGVDDVADAIISGVARRKRVVWVPSQMRGVMSFLRHVPQPIFRRLPL